MQLKGDNNTDRLFQVILFCIIISFLNVNLQLLDSADCVEKFCLFSVPGCSFWVAKNTDIHMVMPPVSKPILRVKMDVSNSTPILKGGRET